MAGHLPRLGPTSRSRLIRQAPAEATTFPATRTTLGFGGTASLDATVG
ncbi:MAG TPA: hypothetical protein VFB06_14225 [Streptosporangiaceae bacterium]|nr:hypothetical protein [Streptosporangiaceae bacterium]